MANILFNNKWSPYLAGAMIGILAVLSVIVTTVVLDKGKYLGASTTFVRMAGFIEKTVASGNVNANEYFQAKKVKVDWQMLLVIGIFFGALISSKIGKSFKSEKVPPMWAKRFGSSVGTRAIGAIVGGTVLMFGARLAGGCPSGHGLSGMMQLAVSSLIAFIFFLVGGFITAKIVYKGGK